MMFCRNCGAEVNENDNFCSYCGKDVRVLSSAPDKESNREQINPNEEVASENQPPKINEIKEATPEKPDIKQSYHERPYPDKPYGLGGLLGVLWFLFLIFGPLLALGFQQNEFSLWEKELAYLVNDSTWNNFKVTSFVLITIQATAFFYAAYLMKNSEKKITINYVLLIVWFFGPVFGTSVIAFMPQFFYETNIYDLRFILESFVVALLSALMFSLYLIYSKRVENTFYLRE